MPLSDAERHALRHALALRRDDPEGGPTPTWTLDRATTDAVFEALENAFETTCRQALASAIEGPAPGLPAPVKRLLVLIWLKSKFAREV